MPSSDSSAGLNDPFGALKLEPRATNRKRLTLICKPYTVTAPKPQNPKTLITPHRCRELCLPDTATRCNPPWQLLNSPGLRLESKEQAEGFVDLVLTLYVLMGLTVQFRMWHWWARWHSERVNIWEFPKIRVPHLGSIRSYYLGSYIRVP